MSLFNRIRYWYWQREVEKCLRTGFFMLRHGETENALQLLERGDKCIAKLDTIVYGSVRA